MSDTGWMPGVVQVRTEAFEHERRGWRPKAVVSHIMQGYQTTMEAWAKQRPPTDYKSAHFTINRDGRILQHVSIYDTAWTNGHVNRPSWNGIGRDSSGPVINPNLYTVTIEHEGFSIPPEYGYDYTYETRPWPIRMAEASLRVHQWVFEELGLEPAANSVIGHYHIDSVSRAECPGKQWRDSVRPWLLTKLMVPKSIPVELVNKSGPLERDDAPALFQLAYGIRINGADYDSLPKENGKRVFKVVLP